MTNTQKLLRERLAAALRLGISFMEGFEDDQTQDTVMDDLKAMRGALAEYETPSPSVHHVAWEIELDASHPREAAELALAIHRDPASIATFFSVNAPDGTLTHHDLGEDETTPLPLMTTLVEEAAAVMFAALLRVAEDFDDTGRVDCCVISLDTLAAVLHALQVAGMPVEIETK